MSKSIQCTRKIFEKFFCCCCWLDEKLSHVAFFKQYKIFCDCFEIFSGFFFYFPELNWMENATGIKINSKMLGWKLLLIEIYFLSIKWCFFLIKRIYDFSFFSDFFFAYMKSRKMKKKKKRKLFAPSLVRIGPKLIRFVEKNL